MYRECYNIVQWPSAMALAFISINFNCMVMQPPQLAVVVPQSVQMTKRHQIFLEQKEKRIP